jgi:hypothetical protein
MKCPAFYVTITGILQIALLHFVYVLLSITLFAKQMYTALATQVKKIAQHIYL